MEKIRSLRNAIGYILLFLSCQFLCVYGVAIVSQLLFLAQHPNGDVLAFAQKFDANWGTAVLALSQALTIFFIWVFAKGRRIGLSQLLGGRRPLDGSSARCLFMAGVFGNLFTTGLMDLLPIPQNLQNSYDQAASSLNSSLIWVDILSVALLAPLVEEMVFRGLAYSRLRRGFPTWFAVAAQGIIFGMIHGQLIWIIYAMIFGMILGWVRAVTGSLKGAFYMHFGFNVASFFIGIVFLLAPDALWAKILITAWAGLLLLGLLSKVWFSRPLEPEEFSPSVELPGNSFEN